MNQLAKEDGTQMDDNFMVDIALNFLIAGRDTTGS